MTPHTLAHRASAVRPSFSKTGCRKPIAALLASIALMLPAMAQIPDLTNSADPNYPTATDITNNSINLGPSGLKGWVFAEKDPKALLADTNYTGQSRQILVSVVDAGSPGATTGILVNDVILGASGDGTTPVNFTSDSRKSLALAIAAAEARSTPQMKLRIWRAGVTSTYTLTLQNLGAYGPNAPVSDAKCDLIVANARQALLLQDNPGSMGLGTLALMALDYPTHPDHAAMKTQIDAEIASILPNAANLASMNSGQPETESKIGWKRGHTLITLSEYYLNYGEHPGGGVFAAIQAHVNSITTGQSVMGTFGHQFAQSRWPDGATTPLMGGYGAINSSAVPGWYGLMLAKQCGVINQALDVSIDRAVAFYGSYAGRGVIPYGEHETVDYEYTTNGKSGAAALALDLAPGKQAQSKYFAKMSAAAFNEYETGHSGCFFQNIWSPLGAAHAGDDAIKSYFAQTSWLYDLARKWDGSFAYNHIYIHDNYGGFNSTMPYILPYALPLKRLHMTGRGRSADGVLNATERAEAVFSGSYDETTRTKAQLITDLGDWSPVVQYRAATALAGMSLTTTDMDTLHALASEPLGSSKAGALRALGKIATASSAPVLSANLSDPDADIRRIAANALRFNPAKAGELNTVLAAAGAAMRPTFPLDSRDPLQHDLFAMGLVLFSADSNPVEQGILYQNPNIVLTGVDRQLLYPAIRAIGSCPTGIGRSPLGKVMNALTEEDVKALGDTIVDMAFLRPPADIMFAVEGREKALDAMTRYRFAEAAQIVERSTRADFNYGGGGVLYEEMFKSLQQLAGTNTLVTPDPDIVKLCQDYIKQYRDDYLDQGEANADEAQLLLDLIQQDDAPAAPKYFKRFNWVVSDAAALTLPANQTQLHASVTDDAKGVLSYSWRKVYGAGNVTFGFPDSKDTSITFDNTPGNYLFEVTVVDARGFSEIKETVAVTLYNSGGTLPSNQPPAATAQAVTVAPATPTPITLTGTDPESAPLVFTVTSGPVHGTLSGTAPNLTYTSDQSYHSGTDIITFQVTDSFGQTSAEATVTITVDSAQLEVQVYEPFNYTAGAGLAGAAGGAGMIGSWNNGSAGPDVAMVYNENGKAGGLPDWDGVLNGYPMQPVGGSRYIGGGAAGEFEAYRPLTQSAAQMAGPDGVLWMSGVWHFTDHNYGAHVGLALTTDSFMDRGKKLSVTGTFGSGAGDGIGVGRSAVTSASTLTPMFFDGGAIVAENAGLGLYPQDWVVVLKFEFGATDKVTAYAFPEGSPIDEGVFNRYGTSTTHTINESALNMLTFSQCREPNAIDEIRIGSNFAAVIGLATSTEDVTPPTPNPLTFSSPPTATSSAIAMTAATASDPNGVEYYFTCTSGNGHDSGWQDNPSYTDTGLGAGTYTYTVKGRDKSVNRTVTAPSAPASAVITGSTPGQIAWIVSNISGNVSDISTTGTPVQAHGGADYGTANVVDGATFVVNGVTFDDGFVFDTPSHLDTIGSRGGSYPAPNAEYGTLMSMADRQGTGNATFTFNGLNAGNTYQIQVWHADNISTAGLNGLVLNNGGVANTPVPGASGHATLVREITEGGYGQYATGTFVAGGSTQQFLARAYGNLTTTPVVQTGTTINGCQLRLLATGTDSTPPTLASGDIVDDQGGAPVPVGTVVVYDVTFNEAMNGSTINPADFSNAGTATGTIGTVAAISPTTYQVRFNVLSTGTLQLRVNAEAVISDLAGNPLNTSAAILDDTIITVTVGSANNAPVASNGSATTNEDSGVAVTLVATDADPGNILTYTVVSAPTKGTLSGTAPNLTYTPNANTNGADSFTFKANDGTVDSNIATVSLTVNAVNDVPVASNGSASTAEDAPVAFALVASDIDGAIQSYTVVTGPAKGTLSGTAPNLTYTPNANTNGADSFTFKANDGTLDSNIATVSLTVTAVNDAPVASNGSATTNEDTSVAITLATTDGDPSDILSYTVVTGPTKGTLSGTAPNLTYTPNANTNGADSFTFKANDGTVDSNTATISLTVTAVNDAPVASNGSAATLMNTDVAVTLAATDIDSTIQGYTVVTGPTNGTLSGIAPNLTYTPNAAYNGEDSFTFKASDGTLDSNVATISITVGASGSIAWQVFNISGNVTDVSTAGTLVQAHGGADLGTANVVDGATFVINGVTFDDGFVFDTPSHLDTLGSRGGSYPAPNAAYGTLMTFADRQGTGNCTFTFNNLTVGSTYQIQVWHGDNISTAGLNGMVVNNGGTTNTPVPGTPGHATLVKEITEGGYGQYAIGTFVASATTQQFLARAYGSLTTTPVVQTGTTINACQLRLIASGPTNSEPVASNGSATTNEDTGVAVTLAATDANVSDVLSYTVVTGPANGTLSGTAPNLTYTPNANANGADSFTFKANDGTVDSNTATISLTVDAVNDAPVASNDSATTDEDTGVAITLVASDIDSTIQSYTVVTGPSNGTLSGTAPNLTYTPNANTNGADSFTFKANDGTVDSNIATVSLTVTAVNDAPVASNDSATTSEDTAVSVTLAATDIDGTIQSYTVVTGPTMGTLSGTVPNMTYTPNANTSGADSFTFTANDGTLDSYVATISLTVTAVNDAPAASNGSATTDEDTGVAITLVAGDIDSTIQSYTVVSGPANGTLSGTAPNLTYTPNANTNGADSFTFRANDGTVDSNTATISLTVNAVNDAPVASNGSATTNEDTAVGITLVATDIESAVTYTLVSAPTNGTLSGTAPNLTYTPNANTNGADSFTFKANDGTVDSNTATVSLTVTAVNDAPVFTVASFTTADASEGAAYTGQTLSGRASDVDVSDTISYSKVSGPAWLAVASNGTLSGTPGSGTTGSNVFVVRATDTSSATADATLTITVVGLPLPWVSSDIGTGMLAGSAAYNAGAFTQAGSGIIGSTSDKLRFTYQTLTGDGEIIARISSLQNTGTSSRVGVMIRDTLAANSKQILMGMTSSGSYRWGRRTTTGGSTSSTNSSTGTVPNTWVRLVRSGTTITAYKSTNGTSWTSVGSATNTTFASTCYIGLAVGSGSDTTLNTSQFSNVSVVP